MADSKDLEKNLPESSRPSLDGGESSSSTLLEQNKSPEDAGITFPSEEATADDIRSYFIDILTLSYNLPGHEAHDISRKWLAGTGRELRKYPGKMFREVFGPQAGWILYKECRISVLKEQYEKKPKMSMKGRASIAAFILALMGGMACLATYVGAWMWGVNLPLYFFMSVTIIVLLADGKMPKAEEVAEKELVKLWGAEACCRNAGSGG